MKNLVLLLVVCLITGLDTSAQTAPDWTRVLTASAYNYPAGRVVTANAENIYMAGNISGPVTFENKTYTSTEATDMIVFKLSNTGTVIWEKQFNAQANGTIIPTAMQLDANQNAYIVGIFTGSATLGSTTIISDATNNNFITKLDPNGNVQWANAFAATGNGSSKMAFDADSSVYLLNKTASLLKFDIAGNKIWEQNYPNRTLQAIAVSGNNLFLGGALQSGTTTFGTINLTKSETAYNKGFIVKADLDGVYSDSLVFTGSPVNDGSSVNDIVVDLSGNLIISGAYSNNLGFRNTTYFYNSTTHYFTYLAKCDKNFVFAWVKSSSPIVIARDNYFNRLFLDNANNIYQYGLSTSGSTTFSYGSVTVVQQTQYLFKFDANGEILTGYGLANTSFSRVFIAPNGKIAVTGPNISDGISQNGNFFIAQYNNDMSLDWQKTSANHQAGTINIYYIKHDTEGNTYAQARIRGYCNFFGTLINSNNGATVNVKFNKSGNILWINQINDSQPSLIYGPKFSLDKDNNLIAAGSFKTSLSVGNQNLVNSNSYDDSYLVKYDPNGQVLWNVQFVTEGEFGIFGITTDKTGNVIVSGEFKNQMTVGEKTIDAGTDDGAFIIKLDAAGNCLWANGYPVGNVVYSAMPACDENNNIYLVGEMYNFTTNQLVFGAVVVNQTNEDGGTVLVKFDADGIPQWAYTYGGVTGASYIEGWPGDIRTDAQGNTYLLGWCADNANFGTTTLINPIGSSLSFYLTKIDNSGGVVWAEAIYTKSPAYPYGDLLDLDKNGNIYVGGHFSNTISIQGITYNPVGTYDFFVTKFTNDGQFDWIKTMPSNSNGITALSVYDEDILSFCGIAGKDPTLGNIIIDKKGGSTSIIATLGILEPTPNTLYVSASDGSATTFAIVSNTSWTATSDQEWLTINVDSGTGNATLTFTAAANTTGNTRTATVTITFSDSKTQSITLTISQVGVITGISELTKQENLIYPNPAMNYLYFNSDFRNALIFVYDINGKMLLNKQVLDNKINIGSLQNGVYTIKIVNKTGTAIKKFVKL